MHPNNKVSFSSVDPIPEIGANVQSNDNKIFTTISSGVMWLGPWPGVVGIEYTLGEVSLDVSLVIGGKEFPFEPISTTKDPRGYTQKKEATWGDVKASFWLVAETITMSSGEVIAQLASASYKGMWCTKVLDSRGNFVDWACYGQDPYKRLCSWYYGE